MAKIVSSVPSYKIILQNDNQILQFQHSGIGDNTGGYFHFRLPLSSLTSIFDKTLYYHALSCTFYTSETLNTITYIQFQNDTFNLIKFAQPLNIDHESGYSFKSWSPFYLLGKFNFNTTSYIQMSFNLNTNLADYQITLNLLGNPKEHIQDTEFVLY